jgi:NAD-dependent SIR2 family protein deacetylase
LKKTYEITFACKKCKKIFRKDMREYEEQDEYCPHCDNHYVNPAGDSKGRLVVSLEGTQDMVRDEREKPRHKDTLEAMGDGVKESRDASVFHTFDA